jgi:hypothetical protein
MNSVKASKGNFQRFINKFLYSKDTHFMLNYFTLALKDKEVKKEYDTARVNNYDKHFWKVTIYVAVYYLFKLY